MALTNAEKQKRWRDRRRALAKQAQQQKARVAKVTSRNGGSDNQKIQQAYQATEYARADWLALINMASDLERTKIILFELKGISPSGIWAEMEARRLVTSD